MSFTRRRRFLIIVQRAVQWFFGLFGLRVIVDLSPGIGYYLLDVPINELIRKTATVGDVETRIFTWFVAMTTPTWLDTVHHCEQRAT